MQHCSNENYYRRAQFATSAARLAQLPADEGREVAFAGRSNAGKSSALNALTDQKGLARTSKTPGRTQLINLFDLDEHRRLVDLPGYGYAKVPEPVKRQWSQTLESYLEQRQALRGLVLIMDVRHPLREFDRMMLQWCRQAGMPVHILLTKADKLKRGPANNTLLDVRKQLRELHPDATAQLFSATRKEGVDVLRQVLDRWLETGADPQDPD